MGTTTFAKPGAPRSTVIDVCRGLLFVLMTNTHALSLAGVPRSSWLFSDLWLPNGWATVAFVVLSGYGVGYVFSVRQPAAERNQALRIRSAEIFVVMLVSNLLFAALRQFAVGDLAPLGDPGWWFGFATLESPWTISGVLLPTALVLLAGPALIPWIQAAPIVSLLALIALRLAISLLTISLSGTADTAGWAMKLLVHEGLGGFPVLSFTVNGFFGIWLGIMHHRRPAAWRVSMYVLLAGQALSYAMSFLPSPASSLFISVFGGVGKFAWMMAVAYLVERMPMVSVVIPPVAKIGKYGLASFIAHRVFLQAVAVGLAAVGLWQIASPELRYVVIFPMGLLLTWLLCVARERYPVCERALGAVRL